MTDIRPQSASPRRAGRFCVRWPPRHDKCVIDALAPSQASLLGQERFKKKVAATKAAVTSAMPAATSRRRPCLRKPRRSASAFAAPMSPSRMPDGLPRCRRRARERCALPAISPMVFRRWLRRSIAASAHGAMPPPTWRSPRPTAVRRCCDTAVAKRRLRLKATRYTSALTPRYAHRCKEGASPPMMGLPCARCARRRRARVAALFSRDAHFCRRRCAVARARVPFFDYSFSWRARRAVSPRRERPLSASHQKPRQPPPGRRAAAAAELHG